MAQNVVINGITYSNVPSVSIPKSGSGTAEFYDISDTTAAAGDVMSTKYFYTSSGQKTQGSLTVPTVSQNATTKVLTIA